MREALSFSFTFTSQILTKSQIFLFIFPNPISDNVGLLEQRVYRIFAILPLFGS